MGSLPDPVLHIIGAARSDGRLDLTEPEAMGILVALGIGVPRHVVVAGAGDVDLGLFSGDRVVVKAVVPGLIHKTEAGGVAVVPRGDVSDAIEQMASRVPAAVQFLVADYVEHSAVPGAELLVGMRWTDEFGPIVTLGPGGTGTELLAELMGPLATAVFSPALRSSVASTLDGWAFTTPLVKGYRGSGPIVDRPSLEALVHSVLDIAAAGMPDQIAEFEMNPLTFTPAGPVALDAMFRIGPALAADVRPDLRPGAVERVLHPASIAIIGVSERMNLGRTILRNVLAAGFSPGAVTVIKPGVDEIDGARCVARVADVGFVDLLVVAIGAEHVPGLVEEVLETGLAASIVLIPGGLGERAGSEEYAGRITAALRTADEARAVINGGNCMGIRSIPGRYDTTFIPGRKLSPKGRDGRHPVAIISQSGAFAIARHDRLPWLDPAYLITVGNQIDLTVGDYLDHIADDPDVDVAACYVEGFRPGDGLRWMGAADRMRARGGTVILYRGGRTEAGARSAASHTAAVAGDTVVSAGLADAAGVLVAGSLSEFEALLQLAVLLRERPAAGTRVGAVTNAGFEAVAIADNLGPLSLADLSDGTIGRLGEILSAEGLDGMVGAINPLDLTPNCTASAYADAIEAMLSDPGVDIGLVGCVPLTPSLETLQLAEGHQEDVGSADSLAARLVALWDTTTKPWVLVVDGGVLYDPMAAMLEEAGVPTFRSADQAIRMLGRYVRQI